MQAIAVALIAGSILFVGVLAGAAMGAVAGWVVGVVFDETIAALLKRLALDVAPWQFGAMLGFVGSFFRTTLSAETKK